MESVPVTGFRAINDLVVNDGLFKEIWAAFFLLFLMMVPGIIFLAFFHVHTSVDTMRLPIYGGRILEIKEKSRPAHRGIFIQPTADFNVRSCSDGKVQNVFKVGADWAMVIVQNDTSYAYAQMDSVMVNPGEFVNRGDLIGQRKLIPNDYKSIIFFVLKGEKELDPEKFILNQN